MSDAVLEDLFLSTVVNRELYLNRGNFDVSDQSGAVEIQQLIIGNSGGLYCVRIVPDRLKLLVVRLCRLLRFSDFEEDSAVIGAGKILFDQMMMDGSIIDKINAAGTN